MNNSDIQPTLSKVQTLIQKGLSYLGSDKDRAKMFFRMAQSELEKLQGL